MSAGKWKVTPVYVKSPWLRGWYADPPGWGNKHRGHADWWKLGGKAFRIREHKDPRVAALNYAERMSRTVSITLPKPAPMQLEAHAGKWVSLSGDGWRVTAKNPTTAAMQILTHHYISKVMR